MLNVRKLFIFSAWLGCMQRRSRTHLKSRPRVYQQKIKKEKKFVKTNHTTSQNIVLYSYVSYVNFLLKSLNIIFFIFKIIRDVFFVLKEYFLNISTINTNEIIYIQSMRVIIEFQLFCIIFLKKIYMLHFYQYSYF